MVTMWILGSNLLNCQFLSGQHPITWRVDQKKPAPRIKKKSNVNIPVILLEKD